MKKLFLVLLVSLSGVCVYAQNETAIELQDWKGPYVTNGLWDNWFISAGGGTQIYFGQSDGYGSFGNRLAPAFDVSAGKWITPSVGVRLQYSGLQAKGWSYGEHPYSEGRPDAQGYYREKFSTMNLHADFLCNISNAIGGERIERFWSISPYLGMGWARSGGNGASKNELAANVGVLHNLRLSDAIDINIDMRGMVVNRRFASISGGSGPDVMATLTAGLTYKFAPRGFIRASDLASMEDNIQYMEQIAALEELLEKAEQRRKLLLQQLEYQEMELNAERSEEPPIPTMPDLAIFFEIGRADLSHKALVNIGYLAQMLKLYPEKRYVLFASADKQTGTPEFNMELSRKRGEAVYRAMVDKFGVDPEQLRIQAVGSTLQKFEGAHLNRVVVIEDQE